MKIKLDARGELCPKPVIMTKKELDKVENTEVNVIVDNKVAKDNISKLINSYGHDFTVEEKENDYYIKIIKDGASEKLTTKPESNLLEDLTIAIGSSEMGSGGKELGDILMKSFIYTVKEIEPLPRAIVLYNSGVYIACEESQIIDDLKTMVEAGVELLVCGTCLDYYNIKDKIQVGEIANMYSIYEEMRKGKTINI